MYSNSNDLDKDYYLLGKRKNEEYDMPTNINSNKRQKIDDDILEDIEEVKCVINGITNSIIKIVNKNDTIEENKNKLKETSEQLAIRIMEDAKEFEINKDYKKLTHYYSIALKLNPKINAAAKLGDLYLKQKPYIAIHYYHTERCTGDELLGYWKLILFFEYYHDEEMYIKMLESCVNKFNHTPAIEKLIKYYIMKGDTNKLNYYITLSNNL